MLHVPLHDPQTMTTWVPTAFRTHTLGELQANGADLVGTEVIVCGFMEANRGKGAICFVDLRDGTGKTQVFLKADTIGEEEGWQEKWDRFRGWEYRHCKYARW